MCLLTRTGEQEGLQCCLYSHQTSHKERISVKDEREGDKTWDPYYLMQTFSTPGGIKLAFNV